MISLSKFGIEKWEPYSQAPTDHQNDVKFIRNKDGIYVLKVIAVSQELFEQMIVLESFLKEKGLPIPKHYKAIDGNYLVTENSCKYALQEYIANVPWSSEDSQIKSLGNTLKIFHESTVKMSTNLPKGNLFENCLILVANSSQELAQKYQEYRSESSKNTWQEIREWIKETVQSSYETAISLGYGDHHQAIHGDYHPHNALYEQNGSVVGIVDFDQACQDDPLNDVFRALLHIYPFDFKQPLPKQMDETICKKKWLTFISSYGYQALEKNYFAPIAEVIGLELVVLYYLKGVQKGPTLSNIKAWLDQIKSTVSNLKLHVVEAATIHK